MQKILSFFLIITMTLFTACTTNEELSNDDIYISPSPTLSSDKSSIKLTIGTSTTIEIEALTSDGTEDTVSIIGSSDIYSAAFIGLTLNVQALSAGTSTIIIKSGSDEYLYIELEVVEADVPTLVIDKTAITMEIDDTASIVAVATTDGLTEDNISVSSSNTAVITVELIENNITVTALGSGDAVVTITSDSGNTLDCNVTVNQLNTFTDAPVINFSTTVADVLTNEDILYKLNLSMHHQYEVNLKKFTDLDAVKVSFYTDTQAVTEAFSIFVEDVNETKSYTFKSTSDITYYVKVSSYNQLDASIAADNVQYELRIVDLGIDYILTPGADYVDMEVTNSSGIVHSFDAQYGKYYEIWVMDSTYAAREYTLDILTSAYTQDMTQAYFVDEDKQYYDYSTINPITTEKVYIQIKAKTDQAVGTYAIKIVEHDSLSDGTRNMPFPISDSVTYSSKVGTIDPFNSWSYYSTEVTPSVTKTISVKNIVQSNNLVLKIYEDTNCTTEVASAESAGNTELALTHFYVNPGTFCIAVNNTDLNNSTTYDIKVLPNKVEGITTYSSFTKYDLVPNVNNLSDIEVKHGLITINKVTVDVNITHTFDEDISIYLISPSGSEILLSANNGSYEDNYVNTVFDDSASISITNATAPFTGSFIPEESLSSLIGTQADGIWSLKVLDNSIPDEGTLDSWSLTIE